MLAAALPLLMQVTPTAAEGAAAVRGAEVAQIQYGVAFTVESVLAPGPLCVEPCIITSGAGIAGRVGHKSVGPLYLGLAYELSKQGSNNIYRLGILQQLRGEGRYYIDTGRVTAPFVAAALGLAGYGNEWAVETKGALAGVGGGAQFQLARDTVVGVALTYRALLLTSFVDSAGLTRGGGVLSMLGLELQLEGLDVWPFAGDRQAGSVARSGSP